MRRDCSRIEAQKHSDMVLLFSLQSDSPFVAR